MHVAPRRQEPPSLGTRPAPLPVVAVTQEWWPGAPRQPGVVVPSLAPPSLADATAEAVDAAALSFLTAQALEVKRKEEEE